MPVSYRIDVAQAFILSEAVGVVTDQDLLDHQQQLRADPACKPWFRELFDFTGATANEVTGRCIRQLAIAPFLGKGSKRALVVPNDSGFGLARMFQTLREDHEGEAIEIFRDLATARAWLGLE